MNKGDIYWVDLEPTQGHEQRGKRYVLILSEKPFNELTKTPIVLPIAQGGNFARTQGFAVSLSGSGGQVQGVIRCDQPRAMDIKSRSGVWKETIPAAIVEDAVNKLSAILGL